MKFEWDKLLEVRVGQITWNWSGTKYLELEWDKLLLEIRVGQTGACNWSGTIYYLNLDWDKVLLEMKVCLITVFGSRARGSMVNRIYRLSSEDGAGENNSL